MYFLSKNACEYVICNQYECSVNTIRMRELFSTEDVSNLFPIIMIVLYQGRTGMQPDSSASY